MLHYNLQHVSSSTMLIFRRTNITASGIVSLCKRTYSMPPSTCILYGRLQRVTLPDAVIIQFCPEDGHSTPRNMLRIIM